MRAPRRAALVVAIVAAGLLFSSPAASAHALLKSSDPSDGALLQGAPSQVVMEFTEPPDLSLSVFHVFSSGGTPVESGPPSVVGGDARRIHVPLGHLDAGVYTVTWRTVSRVDGHLTGGAFTFGVGVSAIPASTRSAAPPPKTPPPSPLSVAGKWLHYWGLALLLGAPVVGIGAFGGRVPGGRRLLLAAWAAAAAGVAVTVAAERSQSGVSLGRLLASGRGHELVAEIASIAAAGIVVAIAARLMEKVSLLLVGTSAAAAMYVHAIAGHPGAASSWRWFKLATQWAHMTAAGVWIGGLVLLLLGLRVETGDDRVRAVARFSFIATIALPVVAATGTLRAIDEVGSLGRLVDTSFGVTLLVKIGLFGVLALLGAVNRFRNVPRLREARTGVSALRKFVTGEVGVAALILLATAVLTGLAPASSVAAASGRAQQQRIVVNTSDFARTIRARLIVTPGVVGLNRFEIDVRDYDTGKPVDGKNVTLRFSLPARVDIGTSSLTVRRQAPGVWVGQGTALAIDGRWHVIIAIEQSNNALEIPVDFSTRSPPEQIEAIRAPGQPTIYTIALSKGRKVQCYVDPGKPGLNEIHFTFFDASGKELPITSATVEADPSSGQSPPVETRRFSAGHFISDATLHAGRWRFRVQATAHDGTPLSAYFDQQM